MEKAFNTRIRHKKDTLANWTSNNPVLKDGELALVKMTDGEIRQKVGDGTTAFNSLPYIDDKVRTELSGKAPTSHGTHVTYSTTAPLAPGTASAGSAATVARSDHRHPLTKDNVTAALGYTPPTTDTKYTHPTTSGYKHIPSGGSSGQILRWSADGTAAWGSDNNTTYSAFKGATSSAAGGTGLVPAPAAGGQGKYLRADGTWKTPPNTTYGNMTGASTTAAGKAGLVPAPSTGAANRYLRSDGTWTIPPNTTYNLGSFGITASAAELNYTDGVTSNIQTQLNALSKKITDEISRLEGLIAAAKGFSNNESDM